MQNVIATIRVWSDMIKLQHSVFALPFAVMAAFLAGRNIEGLHRPYAGQLVLVIICMVAARSVAMTFNRIVDARIDARNPRTAARALPAGRLTIRAAYIFLFTAASVFAAGCAAFRLLYDNAWPILLAGPVLIYLCGYSYSKRFTQWSHFYLGSAIAISPLAAWLAVHPPSLGWPGIVLTAAVAMWIAGFDIIYACQDIEADRRDGLFSIPARLGPRAALLIARACHALVIVLLLTLAVVAPLGWIFLVGVVIVATLLAVENSLVAPTDFSRVSLAFFTINGVVSVILGILAVLDVILVKPGA